MLTVPLLRALAPLSPWRALPGLGALFAGACCDRSDPGPERRLLRGGGGFLAGKFPRAGDAGAHPLPGSVVGVRPPLRAQTPLGGRQAHSEQTHSAGVLSRHGRDARAATYRPRRPAGAGGWCPRAPARRCTAGRRWHPRAGPWWQRHRRGRLRRAARAARSRGWGRGPAGTLLGDNHPPTVTRGHGWL